MEWKSPIKPPPPEGDSTSRTLVLYTSMGQNLSIDAPNFFITHYGKASKIDIVDIGSGLYIEKGYVQNSATVRKGNIRFGKPLPNVFISLSGDVSISLENNVHIDLFSCCYNSSIPFSLSLSGEGDIRHIETSISMAIGVDVEEIDVTSSTCRNLETSSQAHIGTIKASDRGFTSENKLRVIVNEGSKVDEISTQSSDWMDWLVVESSQHVHVWGPGTVTKEPTCMEDGIESSVCTCGQVSDSRMIEALGHDLHGHIGKEPTCLDKGWNQYDTCSRCDYSTYEEIPALGHDIKHVNSKEATCTDIGWDAYEHCSRCSYSTYREIPAKGHSFSSEWSIDSLYHWHSSTCGHSDLTQGRGEHSWNDDNICAICGTKNKGSGGIEIEQPEYEVSIEFPMEWGGSLVVVPNVSATLKAVLEPARDDARYEFIVDGNRIRATGSELILGVGDGKVQLEVGMHVITVIVAFDGTTYSQHYRIEASPDGCGTADSVTGETTI